MVLHKSLGINFCEYFLERYHTKRWHGFPSRKDKRLLLRIIKYKRMLHRSLTSEESLRIAKSWRIFLKSRQKSLRMSSYGIDISKLWYWYFQSRQQDWYHWWEGQSSDGWDASSWETLNCRKSKINWETFDFPEIVNIVCLIFASTWKFLVSRCNRKLQS